MFFTCGPNEAMVVSGESPSSPSPPPRLLGVVSPSLPRDSWVAIYFYVPTGFCRSPPVMVAGGRVLVVPCLQQIQR